MNQYRLTVDELFKAYNYRINGTNVVNDHPVYGEVMSVDFPKGNWAYFYAKTGQVVELNVKVPDAKGGFASWFDTEYEVRASKHYEGEFHPCFNVESLLKVALAIEAGVEYDKGLLYDVELQLPWEFREMVRLEAEKQGVPQAKLMMEVLGSVLRSISKNENSTTGSEAQQADRT